MQTFTYTFTLIFHTILIFSLKNSVIRISESWYYTPSHHWTNSKEVKSQDLSSTGVINRHCCQQLQVFHNTASSKSLLNKIKGRHDTYMRCEMGKIETDLFSRVQ